MQSSKLLMQLGLQLANCGVGLWTSSVLVPRIVSNASISRAASSSQPQSVYPTIARLLFTIVIVTSKCIGVEMKLNCNS